MPAESVVASITDAGRQIGRYFTVVNGIPSTIALVGPSILLASGAPSHPPSSDRVRDALESIGFGTVLVFLVAVMAVGLLLYPLQFATTQLLEGYWGTSIVARRAMIRSTRWHYSRYTSLRRLYTEAETKADACDKVIERLRIERERATSDERISMLRMKSLWLAGERIEFILTAQEARRLAAQYPKAQSDLMPTMLGNVLRRYERMAGAPFRLDAIRVVPYLAQVAGDTEREYHDDARSALDLTVRMAFVWMFLAVTSLFLLWPYGMWLLVPFASSCFAILSYRGAIGAAAHYGTALMVLVALSRASLYRRLGVAMPTDRNSEYELSEVVARLVAGEEPDENVRYDLAGDRLDAS